MTQVIITRVVMHIPFALFACPAIAITIETWRKDLNHWYIVLEKNLSGLACSFILVLPINCPGGQLNYSEILL